MGKQGKKPGTKKIIEQKKEKKPRWRSLLGVSLLVVGVSILAWVGVSEFGAADQKKADKLVESTEDEPIKITTETTTDIPDTSKPTPLGVLPDFVGESNDDVKKAYKFASDAKSHVALKASACYCGCQGGSTHTSLFDCYVSSLLPDDQVIYSKHAKSCGLCIAEGLSVEEWLAEGKSIEEISKMIDEKYKK